MGGAFASEKQVCVCVFLNDCGSEHMNSVSDVYVCVLLTNETYSMHCTYCNTVFIPIPVCVTVTSAKLCTVLSL